MYDENVKGQVGAVIMGDWNSIVGECRKGKTVGAYGLGTQNEGMRGEKLIEFCEQQQLWIANTWFQNHKRRLYTWKSPGDKRYQIDFILINQRFKNSIKNAKTLPGADADTDHNLLVVDMITRLKHVTRKKQSTKRWDLMKLEENKKNIANVLEEKLKKGKVEKSIHEEWKDMKESIVTVLEKEVGIVNKREARKSWITQEMLEKMEERRKWKRDESEYGKRQYRKINNELRRTTDKAREEWMKEQCYVIEKLEKEGKVEEMYKIVRRLTMRKPRAISKKGMKDKGGRVTTDNEDVKKIWEEYIKELYCPKQRGREIRLEKDMNEERDNIGPEVMKWEIEMAVKGMKNRKTVGGDQIPAEILKTLEKNGLERVTDLVNKIYDTGEWPEDLIKTIMVPIPKICNAQECKHYRTISLISHVGKVITKVILERMRRKIEENLEEDQFGFRKGRGTRDAIGCMRMLTERVLELNREICVCFIDYEKAFDMVRWDILLDLLKEIGIDWKDRRLIKHMYLNQKVTVRIGDEETQEITIGRGVRQGCCLSPCLFNLYADKLLAEALEGIGGIKVGGESIKAIKYADDQAIIAENEEELQKMLERIVKTSEDYGMSVNTIKTKVMRIAKTEGPLNIWLKQEKLKQVNSFKYLGSIVTQNGSCTEEIKSRIGQGKIAFSKIKALVTAKNIKIDIRKRFVKCLIWSIVLYGCETWAMKKREEKYLEGFEMWLWRRVGKIGWKEKIRNEEVLRRIGEGRCILKEIKRRKAKWIGHILRGECIQKLVIEGKIEGKRGRGRRRHGILTDLKEGRNYMEMKREAQDRVLWSQQFR